MCLFLVAVKSEFQGRISEGIHQAFVAAESLRMFLVWLLIYLRFLRLLCFSFYLLCYLVGALTPVPQENISGQLEQISTHWMPFLLLSQLCETLSGMQSIDPSLGKSPIS